MVIDDEYKYQNLQNIAVNGSEVLVGED